MFPPIQVYVYFLGLVVFLSTIKMIKVLSFNKRIGMLTATLDLATKPLAQVHYSFSFTTVFATKSYDVKSVGDTHCKISEAGNANNFENI